MAVPWGGLRRIAELLLRITGIVLLSVSSYKIASYWIFQHEPQLFLSAPQLNSQKITLAGKITIPRLNVSVSVVEGDDEDSLALGAGHVPGTSALGEAGNAVVAGHRDSAFRALRNIRIGDQIFARAGQNAEYRVVRTRIVRPDEVSVLRNDDFDKLTLITCYPFHFLGAAPRRYIVEARLVERAQLLAGDKSR